MIQMSVIMSCLLLLIPLASLGETISLVHPANLNQPVFVYNNWSAYDELSDNIELTEELAMKQLNEILRLRQAGIRFDYYVMDAFWYDPDGGYRRFRRLSWPNGPDRWIEACKANRIKPGLWVGTNYLCKLRCIPEWRNSLSINENSLCLFQGGFLPHFMETLQMWYDKGIRFFKFDFTDMTAVTPEGEKQFSKDEIKIKNANALCTALQQFRQKNPDVIFAAFNGYGGEMEGTFVPVKQTVDLRWLTVFDSLYCGDPRPSDVPSLNFWRSMDYYTDHMVRYYQLNGVPLERIDNTGYMTGTTGTCYNRKTADWKGMSLLLFARGGWMNVIYGNLELIDDSRAQWFAKLQSMYSHLQMFGRTYTFGGLPGNGEPYGFCSIGETGSLYTVMNPSSKIQKIELPVLHPVENERNCGQVIFTDAGFKPILQNRFITLGPGQIALAGFGMFADGKYDLGIQEDINIPSHIETLSATVLNKDENSITALVQNPKSRNIRIIMRQRKDGKPFRVSGGAPPNGKTIGKILQIQASQGDQEIPVTIDYDKAVWSGLSWASGEIDRQDILIESPVQITCLSKQSEKVILNVEFFAVEYTKQ